MQPPLLLMVRLLDLATDCVYAMDDGGNIIYANEASFATYGYDRAELLGKNINDLTAGDKDALIPARMARLFEQGEIEFETSHCRRDGSVIPVELRAELITVDDRKVIVCVARDMTERKLAEKVLKRSEERFRTVLEDMDSGYFELDSRGYYVFVNDAMCKILGMSRAEIVAKHFIGFVDPADEAFIHNSRAVIDDVAKKGVTLSGIFGTIVKGDGSKRIIGVSASPMRDAAGLINGVRGITRDITDRRKMEQQLLIAGKLASIGELAAGVAHEINNPLTAIMGYAQLLSSDEEVSDRIKPDLEKIYSQSQRAARIVQNLLTFARSYEPAKDVIDINDLIARSLELRSYEHNVADIQVITDLQETLPGVSADDNQIQQVLLNVIINAEQSIAARGKSGTIKILTRLVEEGVRISVIDDGAGIPREILERLFDPFFTTKDVGGGTGLGLSVCHGIVTNHGGRIYAESVVGHGATFVIELPAADGTLTRAPSAPEKLRKETLPAAVGKRILIVDDETVIRDILARILSERGYQVESASSGTEGLEKIESSRYDIYLLDIKMPGVDGMDMYEIIGAKFPNMMDRVIFITGDTVTKSTLDFLESTKREYFSKPLDFSRLIKTIEQLTASA